MEFLDVNQTDGLLKTFQIVRLQPQFVVLLQKDQKELEVQQAREGYR